MRVRPWNFLSLLLVMIAPALCRGEVAIGDKPLLHFTATSGATVDLAKLRGKIVVVDFWSVSQASTTAEHRLAELYKEHSADGVVFIGICCNRTLAPGQKFLNENNIPWPQYFDGKGWDSDVVEQWDHKHIGQVLIGPNGAVLWTGWYTQLDKQLSEALIATPPTDVDPDMLAADLSLDAVEDALKTQQFSKALQTYGAIPTEAATNKKFAERAADLKPKLQDALTAVLAPADDLIKRHQNVEALNTLEELFKTLKGTPAEKEIDKRVAALQADPQTKSQIKTAQREALGEAAVAAAQKLRTEQKVGAAYRQLKDVVTNYPGTNAANTAADMIKTYEQDPKLMEQVKTQIADEESNKLLSMGRAYAAAGKSDQAREKFQQIIDQYPTAKQAATAKEELDQLK